jgi:P-type Ca2+ transporter type 2C
MPSLVAPWDGLTTAEAEVRLAADGPNEVAAPRRRRLPGRVGHQLADAPTARVVRDGQDRMVPAASLVPGDLVRLEPGDVVPPPTGPAR